MTVALQVAVLTVSDTRTPETDTSGAFLADALVDAGHTVSDRQLVIDDIYQLASNGIAVDRRPCDRGGAGDRRHWVFGSRFHAGSAQPSIR